MSAQNYQEYKTTLGVRPAHVKQAIKKTKTLYVKKIPVCACCFSLGTQRQRL